MAQFYKTKNNEINREFFNYFYLNDFNNYECIYIINNSDYEKVIKLLNIDNVVIFGKDIVDENPIYMNLQILNKANTIYLRDNLKLLNDDSIKHFITNFKGIFIVNRDLINYLKELNIIKENYELNDNFYLKIDKYGIKNEIKA